MSQWPSAKSKRVLAALLRIGWTIKRESGSHKTLSRLDWPDFVFAFHDKEEIGPRMLAGSPNTRGYSPKIFNKTVRYWKASCLTTVRMETWSESTTPAPKPNLTKLPIQKQIIAV